VIQIQGSHPNNDIVQYGCGRRQAGHDRQRSRVNGCECLDLKRCRIELASTHTPFLICFDLPLSPWHTKLHSTHPLQRDGDRMGKESCPPTSAVSVNASLSRFVSVSQPSSGKQAFSLRQCHAVFQATPARARNSNVKTNGGGLPSTAYRGE